MGPSRQRSGTRLPLLSCFASELPDRSTYSIQRRPPPAPSTPTLIADSQNVSAQDYDDAVEATPTDASSANSTGTADEVGSHDGWVGEDGPRRGKSPRVVAAQYPPATREALLAELPPRPVIAGPTSVPHSLDLSSSQPSASSGEDLVPLSSEDVRNHPCLLTLSELEETTALLTGRVDFQTKRCGKITGGRASPGRGLRSGFDVQVGEYIEVGQTGLKVGCRRTYGCRASRPQHLLNPAKAATGSKHAHTYRREVTMSDSDSQNVSAQDYDDAVEATPTDASSANSTGTADEVGSHDGWVGEDGPRRGKSPRVVAAQYPPATREALLAELPPRPVIAGPTSVPHSLDLSSSQPSASSGEDLVPLSSEDVRNHPCLLTLSELEETTALLTGRVDFQTKRSLGNYPTATRALKNAVVKISAEAYEYWVFRSPDSVAAADLEPPDYSQPEKYVPKKMAGSSTAAPTSGTTKKGRVDFQVGMVSSRLNEVADQWFGFCFPFAGMVLERSFAPLPSGPKKPRPKVTLGGSKAPLPADVPPTQGAVPPLPASSTGTASAAELQVVRPASRRGKEKAADQEVEEIPPPKKQKRPIARGSTPVLDALREGGEHTASFIDKVRAVIPTREAIRDLDTDQVGEMIAQSVLWLSHMTNDLFCRAKAAENVVRKDVVPLRESLAAKDKELTEKVQALEARIASAELEVEAAKRETAEMNERMSSYANLSGFLCRDPREAEAFFRAFIHKEVGEELAWRYGAWAHAKGRFEMQQAVREALEESLNEKDFTTVMSVMPDPVPAPGPMPYADPAPGDDAPAPAKAVLLTTGGLAEPPGLKPTGLSHVVAKSPTSVHQRIDVLPHAPPTYLGLIAATGRKHSADEGTHYPQPRPLPSGSGEMRETVRTGRGKGLTVSARTGRDGAPGVRDSAGFPGPGNTWAVEKCPAGTGRGSDNTGGCPATMGNLSRELPWGAPDTGTSPAKWLEDTSGLHG
nr:uncharacterized protein LOC109184184 [Ipomoea trifida]